MHHADSVRCRTQEAERQGPVLFTAPTTASARLTLNAGIHGPREISRRRIGDVPQTSRTWECSHQEHGETTLAKNNLIEMLPRLERARLLAIAEPFELVLSEVL